MAARSLPAQGRHLKLQASRLNKHEGRIRVSSERFERAEILAPRVEQSPDVRPVSSIQRLREPFCW
jgi:hypothetical protein